MNYGGAGGDGRVSITCATSASPPATRKIVFATGATFQGNLGGINGADSTCQSRATAAGLSGTFKAWLASSGSDDPDARFIKSAVPYELPDGTKVADNWADLTDGTLDAAITRDENGNSIGTILLAWTNVLSNGLVESTAGTNAHCNGWNDSDSGPDGFQGTLSSQTSLWTDNSDINVDCDDFNRLICFEQ